MSSIKTSDKAALLSALASLTAIVHGIRARTCDQCDDFEPEGGYCKKYAAVVPDEARPDGCDGWRESIPF